MRCQHKETIPSIEIESHMWLKFPIHEEIARHNGQPILKEKCSNTDYLNMGIVMKRINKFRTLRHAFPQFPQRLFPNERPNVVSGHHLHFTQLLSQKKVSRSKLVSPTVFTLPYDLKMYTSAFRDVRQKVFVSRNLNKWALKLA